MFGDLSDSRYICCVKQQDHKSIIGKNLSNKNYASSRII